VSSPAGQQFNDVAGLIQQYWSGFGSHQFLVKITNRKINYIVILASLQANDALRAIVAQPVIFENEAYGLHPVRAKIGLQLLIGAPVNQGWDRNRPVPALRSAANISYSTVSELPTPDRKFPIYRWGFAELS